MRKCRMLLALALAGLMTAATLTGCDKGKAPSTTTPGTPAPGTAATKAEPDKTGAPSGAPAPTQAAAGVQFPEPQVITNADVFGLLKVRDINKLIDRVAAWASAVQPGLTSDTLRTQAQMMIGLDLKEFRSGEAISAFVLAPPTPQDRPALVGLLPVPVGSQTVQALKQRMAGQTIAPLGQYTMVAEEGTSGTALAQQMSAELINMEKAPAPSDVQAYLNVAALMQKYGPMVNQWAQMAPMMLASMGAQQQGAQANQAQVQQLQQILTAELKAVTDFLDQAQYVNLGLSVDPERLDLSLMAKGKPGTGLEKTLQKPATNAPDYTQYLDKNSIVRFQQTVRDMKGFMEVYMKYAATALSSNQAAMDKLKADLTAFQNVGTMTMGQGFNLSPEGKLLFEGVGKCDNNDLYVSQVRKMLLEWLNQGPIHDMYKGMGVDLSVKEDPTQRKVSGAPVYHFTFNVQVTGPMPEEQKAKMQKLIGGLALEMANINGNIVFTLNEPVDAVAARLGTKGEPIEAEKIYQPGGVFYVDLNLARALELMKSTMPPEQAAKVPNLAPNAPPITVAAYLTGGVAYGRLGIPKGLLTSLAPQMGAPGAPTPPMSAPGAGAGQK